MKEQDAAHSFEKALEDYKNKSIIDFLCGAGSYDGYWWGEKPNDKRPPFWWRSKLREEFKSKEAELTRLRSELQTFKDALEHCKVVGEIRQEIIAEHDKARNQAIQDCIDIVSITPGDENIVPKLEALKTIS